MATLKELLDSLSEVSTIGEDKRSALRNTRETWTRIANKDPLEELEFSSASEKDQFLSEWIQDNPYAAMS